jgi:hypothetical protein
MVGTLDWKVLPPSISHWSDALRAISNATKPDAPWMQRFWNFEWRRCPGREHCQLAGRRAISRRHTPSTSRPFSGRLMSVHASSRVCHCTGCRMNRPSVVYASLIRALIELGVYANSPGNCLLSAGAELLCCHVFRCQLCGLNRILDTPPARG